MKTVAFEFRSLCLPWFYAPLSRPLPASRRYITVFRGSPLTVLRTRKSLIRKDNKCSATSGRPPTGIRYTFTPPFGPLKKTYFVPRYFTGPGNHCATMNRTTTRCHSTNEWLQRKEKKLLEWKFSAPSTISFYGRSNLYSGWKVTFCSVWQVSRDRMAHDITPRPLVVIVSDRPPFIIEIHK